MNWKLWFAAFVALDAAADAIDHGKGQRRLGALWHLSKRTSQAFLFLSGAAYDGIDMGTGALLAVFYWLGWQAVYVLSRDVEIWRLDDRVNVGLIEKLWWSVWKFITKQRGG